MAELELMCLLLIVAAALNIVAGKIGVPYPVLLVLSGLALSFIPNLPEANFDPRLALIAFLPPLLYPAALLTSWRDFRRNSRPISLLAVGLVLVTIIAVAWVAHAVIPGLPWSAAFVLGAIVSPPDAVAATAVLERIEVPNRIIAILEGESLVNDSIALVAYYFGIAAVVTGTFSITEAALRVPIVALGGILIGWITAVLIHRLQKHLDDPPVQITISLLTPFIAYIPADKLGLSGVLAVVTAGLYIGWRLPLMVKPFTRLEMVAFWRMLVFLLNSIIFILIGLQMPQVVRGLTEESWLSLIFYAIGISATVIIVRILWVFPAAYLPRLFFPSLRQNDPFPDWRNVTLVAWCGMRGGVSLAIALALPLTTAAGTLFPFRNYIIFLSFCVILVTLVLQGFTLPSLIRILHIKDDGATKREERIARRKANEAALGYINSLAEENQSEEKSAVQKNLFNRLQAEYRDRISQLEYCDELATSKPDPEKLPVSIYRSLMRKALHVERETIINLRNQHFINDQALRSIQRDLDLAETSIDEAEGR